MQHEYWVYMMASEKGNLYIGVTNSLARRVYEHAHDMVDGYSKEKQCHRLVYFESTNSIDSAIEREKQLKGWRREKKCWLIKEQNPGWRDLSRDFNLDSIQ